MGRRARRRGAAPSRTRARQAKAGQSLRLEGLSKPVLDAANEKSQELFGLGIGVLVQEEDRARRIAESYGRAFPFSRAWYSRRRARQEHKVWEGRLRLVTSALAAEVPKFEPREGYAVKPDGTEVPLVGRPPGE